MSERTFKSKPADDLVTSVRLTEGRHHDFVRIWNRRGLAGSLTLQAGDGFGLVLRLMPNGCEEEGA